MSEQARYAQEIKDQELLIVAQTVELKAAEVLVGQFYAAWIS